MELGPVDRITADAIGDPGSRIFYIQARVGTQLVTVVVEKEQMQLLAASILEILSRVGKETGEGPSEDEMGLEGPVEPEWRVGKLSIGYEEQRDLILLELEEQVLDEAEEGEQEESAAPGREPDKVRLWATREQMLALSRHSAAVTARGRPECPYCGLPMDPEGHTCPAMNGHRA